MLTEKNIVVIMPAYNAGKTLEKTFREIPFDVVDEVILTDDRSSDDTIEVARKLGIKHIVEHDDNRGYGGNQKSCYNKALELNADIIVMLHPDYQYTPKLITAMASILANDLYDVVIASRILSKGALKGGMPLYKWVANRALTLFQNIMMGQKLSEYHTGYRAYTSKVLREIDFNRNSDDFVFDNQFLAQILYKGFQVAEVSCPTKYFEEASSINFIRSSRYGLGVILVSVAYFLSKLGLKTRTFRKL